MPQESMHLYFVVLASGLPAAASLACCLLRRPLCRAHDLWDPALPLGAGARSTQLRMLVVVGIEGRSQRGGPENKDKTISLGPHLFAKRLF